MDMNSVHPAFATAAKLGGYAIGIYMLYKFGIDPGDAAASVTDVAGNVMSDQQVNQVVGQMNDMSRAAGGDVDMIMELNRQIQAIQEAHASTGKIPIDQLGEAAQSAFRDIQEVKQEMFTALEGIDVAQEIAGEDPSRYEEMREKAEIFADHIKKLQAELDRVESSGANTNIGSTTRGLAKQ